MSDWHGLQVHPKGRFIGDHISTTQQIYRIYYFVAGDPVPARMEWHAERSPLFVRPRAHRQGAAPSRLPYPRLSENAAGQSTSHADFLQSR